MNEGSTVRLAENALERTGYRLPTEAEWEYAARAGTGTSSSFGRCSGDDPVLTRYAWFLANGKNHAWPVGRLKPNDLGLFDTMGNAHEWCLDERRPYCNQDCFQPRKDTQPDAEIKPDASRVLRGGWFHLPANGCFPTARSWARPNHTGREAGFRLARTLGPASPVDGVGDRQGGRTPATRP